VIGAPVVIPSAPVPPKAREGNRSDAAARTAIEPVQPTHVLSTPRESALTNVGPGNDSKAARGELKVREDSSPGNSRPEPAASNAASPHPPAAATQGSLHAEPAREATAARTDSARSEAGFTELAAATGNTAASPTAGRDPSSSTAAARASSPAGQSSPAFPSASGEVQAARIVERAGQAEMHIGIRSSAFGSVEVHTVVRESQVGLTIGSEKGDLHALLAPEIPALQSSLGQHELRFDHVRFLPQAPQGNSGFSAFAGSHSSPDQQPRPEFAPPHSGEAATEKSGKREENVTATSRLNIHA